jgi:nicotinate phosphoribosyltransferase
MVSFHTAKDEEIKKGLTTDIYFKRTRDILREKGVRKKVVAEFTLHTMKWDWVVFVGVEELVNLLSGLPVDLYCLPEGTIFTPFSKNGVPLPVAIIEGFYDDFAVFETPCLGCICQASGIASKAARMRLKAWDKYIVSFGVRRMHPAISPMIDRAAYIGGCDAVSGISGAKLIEEEPQGTMPHALLITMGEEEGWRAYDEVMEPTVSRVALIDTFDDEKFAAIHSAETLERLDSVRLDTPSSRKGDFADLIREVRWELDIRGYRNVKIFISGGINEDTIETLAKQPVDGFGIGTSISNAPTLDFSMDIVAINGIPFAKRGRFSGRKNIYRGESPLEYYIYPEGGSVKEHLKLMTVKYLENGKPVEKPRSAKDIRKYVMEQLSMIKNEKKL